MHICSCFKTNDIFDYYYYILANSNIRLLGSNVIYAVFVMSRVPIIEVYACTLSVDITMIAKKLGASHLDFMSPELLILSFWPLFSNLFYRLVNLRLDSITSAVIDTKDNFFMVAFFR